MDTRLKNNKKALRMAVVTVALAAACFALVAMNSKFKVHNYYIERDSNFESDLFLNVLFQWNYVLYPEILEKSGKNANAEDLYLSFEEEMISGVEMEDYYGTELVYQGSSEQIRAEYLSELRNNLLRTDSLYTSKLSTNLDYCVIDGDTQTVLKNTAREIEALADEDSQEYAYYIMMHYDKNGNISDISVRSRDSEQFLKSAQLVANSAGSLLLDEEQKVMHYVLANESDVVDRRVTVTQKNPQNVIFIYAMTEEQMGNFTWSFPVYRYNVSEGAVVTGYIGTYNKEMLYDRLVGRWYLLLLAAITVIFGLLARYMPQYMADTAGSKHSAEFIWLIQLILAAVLYPSVVTFVYFVNEEQSITAQIDFVILSGVMFLLFGLWYWCLLSIRDLFSGLRPFLQKRSLLYRYWERIKKFFRKIRDRWRGLFASVDLGKDTTRLLKRLVVLQFVIVSLVCCCWIFGIFVMVLYSALLYMGLKRYIGKVQVQYKKLMQATNAIAQGKFDNAFEGDFGIFESYKDELYQIQGGFRTAVEEEVKSQRMKTELVTNVSHDLKTPLTAIITYIDLLKEENTTEEQRKSYLDTLERKSLRLKVLIEDLFEISKASSGNVRLEPVAVDICNLMRQVQLEHEDVMKENGLDMRFDLPEEKIILQLDSQKTYRIFENLYVNVTKYAMPNTRVYVQAKMVTEGGRDTVHIEMKNISAQELTVNPMDLTERFVRGDASRNTEGSGLGLAIAKSFTELQGGRFHIGIDGDLFKAVIEWDV